jgi:hypothetical protein
VTTLLASLFEPGTEVTCRVTVNGRSVPANQRVAAGDVVLFWPVNVAPGHDDAMLASLPRRGETASLFACREYEASDAAQPGGEFPGFIVLLLAILAFIVMISLRFNPR